MITIFIKETCLSTVRAQNRNLRWCKAFVTEGFGNFSNLLGFVVISFAVGFILRLPFGVCTKVHASGHARRYGVTFHKLSNIEEIVSQSGNGVTRLNVGYHIALLPRRLS